MFDDLSFVDDKECSGKCDKCPWSIWVYPYDDDAYPNGCKIGVNK